jgi:hypothetical protein
VILDLQDFADISEAVPLMAKVYPNGLADVNHFHAAGGLAFLIGQLAGRWAFCTPMPRRSRATGLAFTGRNPCCAKAASPGATGRKPP